MSLVWQSATPASQRLACAFGIQTTLWVLPHLAHKENGLPHQSADWFAMTVVVDDLVPIMKVVLICKYIGGGKPPPYR